MNFLKLEFLLLVRNRITKTFFFYGLLMTVLLNFIGFFVIGPQSKMYNDNYQLFIICFSMVFAATYYGAFLLSWRSSFFDQLISLRPFKEKEFIRSQYLFYFFLLNISFLVSLPFAIYQGLVFEVITFFTFHAGVTLYFIIAIGLSNKLYIDFEKALFSNMILIDSKRINLVLVIGLPIVIILAMKKMNLYSFGLGIVFVIGVIGLLLYPLITSRIYKHFEAAKFNARANFKLKQDD